jgi:hypothetical protein
LKKKTPKIISMKLKRNILEKNTIENKESKKKQKKAKKRENKENKERI